MLDFRECRAMENGDRKVHLNYLFSLCIRASCSQCCPRCFGQFMWENFCTCVALPRFSSWNFHIAISCLVQQSRRRYFVDIWLQDNYAPDAVHVGEALRCICNVNMCQDPCPFSQIGHLFVMYFCYWRDNSKGYLTAIWISYASDLLWEGTSTYLPGREPERT